MRMLCLYFPRLSTILARRELAVSRDVPLVLVSGTGDHALVAGASVEAAMSGVTTGMSANAARQRCPSATFLPDNANASLEALERVAAILRISATPFVGIVSREHVVLSLAGLEGRFADEAVAAERLASIARDRSGADVRAGVGDSIEEAREAARGARRCPVIAPATGSTGERIATYDESRHLTAAVTTAGTGDARAVRASLLKQLGWLEALLEGRHESTRRIRLVLERPGAGETLLVDSPAPMHSAAEMAQLLSARTSNETFAGVTSLAIACERLGPSVRVERASIPSAARAEVIAAPVRPVQQRLLRAG